MGSDPGTIPVPGAEGSTVFHVVTHTPKKTSLAKRVVVIGGAETGRETAFVPGRERPYGHNADTFLYHFLG